MPKPSPGGLVYSTDAGRMCPACRQAVVACICGKPTQALLGDGSVRVSRQSKGRGGKTVTLVRGLALDAAALALLGKQLRGTCGSGGTVKDGVLELQGDHVDRVVEALTAAGHRARRSGG